MSKQRARLAVWSVYIVECRDRTLYTGIAVDVARRVEQHNTGKGAKYTNGRKPVRLVYAESCLDRGAALRREHQIKRLSAADKRKLIQA